MSILNICCEDLNDIFVKLTAQSLAQGRLIVSYCYDI